MGRDDGRLWGFPGLQGKVHGTVYLFRPCDREPSGSEDKSVNFCLKEELGGFSFFLVVKKKNAYICVYLHVCVLICVSVLTCMYWDYVCMYVCMLMCVCTNMYVHMCVGGLHVEPESDIRCPLHQLTQGSTFPALGSVHATEFWFVCGCRGSSFSYFLGNHFTDWAISLAPAAGPSVEPFNCWS